MKKKSVALLGMVFATVLFFGGCGKEQIPVEDQSVVAESTSQDSLETTESSSVSSEVSEFVASESESVPESESTSESESSQESVAESSAEEEVQDAYLEPLRKCLEALVDGNMMRVIEAMPEKYAEAFIAGMKALGMSQEEIEDGLSKEPQEGADKITFRFGEATPKTADEIAAYSAMLNDIAPMVVTEGYSVMVYAVNPDGEESGKTFDVYKVDGKWTLSILLLDNPDEEESEEPDSEEPEKESEEPEKEYTLDNYTTLEEYYKIPAVAKAIETEMEQVRENFKTVYVNCTFQAVGNEIHYDYYYIEGVKATEENKKKMEEAFPATATQLKNVMDSLERATKIRPEKIVCTYHTCDGEVIYEGVIE